MRTAAYAVILLLAGATCSACGSVPASSQGTAAGVVVTQVPAGGRHGGWPDRLSPDLRYPAGSRVVLVPDTDDAQEVHILSGDLIAAGAPDVSPEANEVLFAGKATREDRWAIYAARLRGGAPRLIHRGDGDCIDPAYLASGRIVFACSDDDGGWSLQVSTRDGGDVERITFGATPAFDPTPLPDGRILFSQGRHSGDGIGLLTVNPDGGLLQAFAGGHDAPPMKARSRATADGGVVFLAAEAVGAPADLRRIEMRRPGDPARRMPLSSGGTALIPTSAEPRPQGGLVLAARPADPTAGGWGVYVAPADGGDARPLFDDPVREEVDAIPVAKGTAPRGRPSSLDRDRSTGTVVCYDAARSDGTVGPPTGAAPPATYEVESSGADGARLLHRTAVEADGSFLAELPSDRPLRVRTRDADGDILATSDWFWVRPGEVRACFGCHEGHHAAPANRVVQALLPGMDGAGSAPQEALP